jgi:hypothetical protein
MAIYEPQLALTGEDREALYLLGQLVLSSEEGGTNSNYSKDSVPLSPSDAHRLLELLEKFRDSRLFQEGAYFAETLASDNGWTNDRLREIYLSWRRRRGKTRVHSSSSWNEFILRSGFAANEDAWMWPRQINRTPVTPMTLEHFLKMEGRLAETSNLHPRVAKLLLDFVSSNLGTVETIRRREYKVRDGSLSQYVKNFVSDLKNMTLGREREPMARRRVIAVTTILMDTAALFATRDWTATGTISMIASVVPDAITSGNTGE